MERKIQRLKKKHLDLIKCYNFSIEFDLEDLEPNFFRCIERLRNFKIIDSEKYLFEAQKSGMKILAEGAQGSLLRY